MNLQPRRQEEPNVNITPLIDIVFILLIFFMVSTTFRKESELWIDLPEASRQPLSVEQQRYLEVTIDAAGHYFIDGQILADDRPETLQQALMAIADDHRERPFIIRADAKTPHQAVVTAMDVAGQLGFRHITIPTNPPSGRNRPVTGH